MRIAVTGGSGFIGTNFVAEAVRRGHQVLSLDCKPPRDPRQHGAWVDVDLLQPDSLERVLRRFSPTHVVHLAARTDLVESRGLTYYAANTDGLRHLIAALSRVPGVERVVFASTMLVCRYGYVPKSDTDYCPDTQYGLSKVIGERLVRNGTLPFKWTIVRPTSIWGPWCEEPYRRFLASVLSGRYVHPGSRAVPKALGFVGNTVFQIFTLLTTPDTAGGTFYLQDYSATTIREWANTVQQLSVARRIPTAPVWAVRLAARTGDLLKRAGWDPPLTTFRLRNMLTSSSFDVSRLKSLTGDLPFGLHDGVRLTIDWLRAAQSDTPLTGDVPPETRIISEGA